MKPNLKDNSFCFRDGRPWAAAFLTACFSVAPLPAQSNTTSSSSMTQDNSAPGSGDATPHVTDEFSLKRSDRRFLQTAFESNQEEIALARLASLRAARPEVRSYAQQLISEHEQLGQALAILAADKGVTLPAAMRTGGDATTSANQYVDVSRTTSGNGITASPGAPAAAAVDRPNVNQPAAADSRPYRHLAQKQGVAFDAAFVDLMADEHQADVKRFQTAAMAATDAEVRRFASQHMSALQAHVEHANELMNSVAE